MSALSSRSVIMLSRVTSSPTRSQSSRRSSGSLLSGVKATGVRGCHEDAGVPSGSSEALGADDTQASASAPSSRSLSRASDTLADPTPSATRQSRLLGWPSSGVTPRCDDIATDGRRATDELPAFATLRHKRSSELALHLQPPREAEALRLTATGTRRPA